MQRVLNKQGEKLVNDWLAQYARKPAFLEAWYLDAEEAAMNAQPGDDIVIELRASDSKSGRPETLTIPLQCFDKVK